MPKQIKKKEFTKGEKRECILAIIAMAAALCFSFVFILMIADIDKDSENVQFVKSAVTAGGYVLYVAVVIAEAIVGFTVYRSSKAAGVMIRSFFAAVSAFTALLSLRFMLALFFSGLGKDSIVKSIIGDNSYAAFIKNQAPGFACLVISLSIMMFVGVSAIVKLVRR